jgi:hypothetical protein
MAKESSFFRGLVFLALFAIGSCLAWAQSKQQKREAAYQSKLQSYSEALKPGMPRKVSEEYIRTKGTAFGQLCCIEETSVFADLVKIGNEKHPWYCEEHNVYIAFQFAALLAPRRPGGAGMKRENASSLPKRYI